jgi:uncharacterized protein YjeT (DUF2065 family)
MTFARAIEIFAVVNFAVVGLSHVAQPRAWVELFAGMRSLGYTGVFLNGMLSLLVGSIIVAFHNQWTGLPALLTAIGWMQVVKGAISLTMPRVGMRGLLRVSMDRAWEFQAAGAGFLAIAALISWSWRS